MKKLICLLWLFSVPVFAQNCARMVNGVNAQTGTSYTLTSLDALRLTTFSNVNPINVNLPSGLNAGFGACTVFSLQNLGPGVLTLTCAGCTIASSGAPASTLSLASGAGADIYSAGINYSAQTGSGTGGGGGAVSAVFTRAGVVSAVNTDYGTTGILQVGTGTLPIAKTSGGTLSLGSATNYFHILDDPGGSGIFQTAVDPKNDVFSMGSLGGNGTVQFGAMAGNALFSGMIMDSQSGTGEVGFLFGSPAVNRASFKSTGAAMQMPLAVTNTGVFSNSQMNLYMQSLVNSCNPLSEFSYIFTPPSKTTEAITGCVTVPSGSGVFQGNGVAGYVNNQSGSTTPAVAVFGLARVSVQSSGRIWGGNFVASGATGFPSVSLYGTENDCNVFNAGDVCHGMLINGSFATQPTVTIGVEVTPPVSAACPTCTWPYGVRFDQGATKAPDVNNAGVYFNPVAAGNGQVSQGISFLSTLGGGSPALATLNEDANGNVVIGQSTSGALVTAPIFDSTTGFSLSGNLGAAGQCLTSTGSASAWASCATGTVGSVSGTSNQTVSSGGATPVVSLFGGVTGGSSPLIFPGNLSALQFANGDDLNTLTRKTDTVPTGNFSKWKTAGGLTIGTLDITGNLTLPAFITNATGAGNQGFAQGSDNCVAQLAFITAQFSVNGICEEAPTSVTAPFYIVKAGTAPAAASVRTYTTASGSPLSTTQSFTPVTGNSAHIQTADATVAGAASGVIATLDGSGNTHSSGININTYLPAIQGPSGGAYTNSANNVASTVMTYSNTIPASTPVLITCVGSYKFTTAVNTAEFALNFTSAPTNLFLNVEIGGNATTGTHTYGRQTTNGTLVSAGIAAASTGLYLPVTISGGVTTNAATTFTIQGAQLTNAGSSVLNVDQNGFMCSVK